MRKLPYILLIALAAVSCSKGSIPKPYGYARLDIPDTAYAPIDKKLPYAFDLSKNAYIAQRTDEPEWIDVVYPGLNAKIHCSYQPVKNNLLYLSDDAQHFVYKHSAMANAISEQGFENDEQKVYGVLYELSGNTASPYQFYLTDSTKHFLRAAVYFSCIPNRDSLAPAIEYIRMDVERMIESFEWK